MHFNTVGKKPDLFGTILLTDYQGREKAMKHYYHYYAAKNNFNFDKNYHKIQKELHKCPICGAGSYLIFPYRFHEEAKEGKIQCSNCGAYVIADTMYQAIDDWNNGYIVSKEEKDPFDISFCRGDTNYFEDNACDNQYFLTHVCCGHVFDGKSIYALA